MSGTIFDAYARYYDLLYAEKDYRGEAEFVDRVLRGYLGEAGALLDLGCGTGRHDVHLAERGWQVTGVDRSGEMVAAARDRAAGLVEVEPLLEFHEGDIRDVRLNRRFDAVVALFHVMSYQVTNSDLRRALSTARAHLRPGGILLFDCWYGPGVLTDPPTVRIKRLMDQDVRITRLSEPSVHPNTNRVDVHYTLFVEDGESGGIQELEETHAVRYLFAPEVALLLEEAGFALEGHMEWGSDRAPDLGTWSACFVARADG